MRDREGVGLGVAIRLAALVPLAAGLAGVATGFGFLGAPPLPDAAASHARYLSGLLAGIGCLGLWCAAAPTRRRDVFHALCAVVIAGGLARAAGLAAWGGGDAAAVLLPLAMELGVVPALLAASLRRHHA